MKKSLMALAVSLAAVSGAHAAWNTGTSPDYTIGNGELLLSIFDPVTQSSYVQDLGVTFEQVRGGYSGTITLDPVHIAVFGGDYSNVQYSIMAASNKLYTPDYSAEISTQAGIIYSLVQGQNHVLSDANSNTSGINNAWASWEQVKFGSGFDTNPDENPGFSVTNGGIGYIDAPGYWTSKWNGEWGRDLSGVNGETVELWLKGWTQDDGYGDPLDLLLSTATLNLSAGLGSLTIASSAIPVPAAAWLLGSALVGLGGVARRRRSQA